MLTRSNASLRSMKAKEKGIWRFAHLFWTSCQMEKTMTRATVDLFHFGRNHSVSILKAEGDVAMEDFFGDGKIPRFQSPRTGISVR